jgi:MEMO1 family protein
MTPSLRPLDFQPVIYQGQQMYWLRDPLELTDYQIILPPIMAGMLMFFDGQRNLDAIHQAFCNYVGDQVDYQLVAEAVAKLDEACLLDNDRAWQAQQSQLAAYRAQPFRPPALAGHGYAADPLALAQELAAYGGPTAVNGAVNWQGRAIISPHIDYGRGGAVYAQVWRAATTALNEADLILIFGTDHNGSSGKITLTRLPYATPFGVLPTDAVLVADLAAAVGDDLFTEELHHRREHSVELSAVWAHYLREGDLCPVVPLLCGSFHEYVRSGRHPEHDPHLNQFIAKLRDLTAGRRVLAVASVDFAHVGPAFGDQFGLDRARRAALKESDARLFTAINEGDHGRFYAEIAQVQDQNRICGFSSIYMLLRYLEQTSGQTVAYAHCPADDDNQSLVSIGGLLLS